MKKLPSIRCTVSPFQFSHVVDHIGWLVSEYGDVSRIVAMFGFIFEFWLILLKFELLVLYMLVLNFGKKM